MRGPLAGREGSLLTTRSSAGQGATAEESRSPGGLLRSEPRHVITHGAAAAELMEAEALGGTFLGVCRIVTQPCSIDLLLPVVEHLGEVGERVLDRTALKVGGLADGRARRVKHDAHAAGCHARGDRLLLVERADVEVQRVELRRRFIHSKSRAALPHH